MGGTQASSDAAPRPPTRGFPSEAGGLADDEFRRTYFGTCRAELIVPLDASKERRNDCEAKALDNMEGFEPSPRKNHVSRETRIARRPELPGTSSRSS
jgi:hypothetical protein